MARYRTKRFEIEAVLFADENYKELFDFTDGKFYGIHPEDRGDDPEVIAEVYDKLHSTWVGVKDGQYIIKGMKGEFYPCDAEVFHTKYEEITRWNKDE